MSSGQKRLAPAHAWIIAGTLLLLVLSGVSLGVGVGSVFSADASDNLELVLSSRLPRTLAVVLTGASLAIADLVMQSLVRNRFVDPMIARHGSKRRAWHSRHHHPGPGGVDLSQGSGRKCRGLRRYGRLPRPGATASSRRPLPHRPVRDRLRRHHWRTGNCSSLALRSSAVPGCLDEWRILRNHARSL